MLLCTRCRTRKRGKQGAKARGGHDTVGSSGFRTLRIPNVSSLRRTLDDILLDLRGKNISELHSDQRYAAVAKVDRAYRIMYDKEDCERYERGLKILGFAKRDLHLLAQDIFGKQ